MNKITNFQASDELVEQFGNYPVGSGDDLHIIKYLGDKMCEHARPIFSLLRQPIKYGMKDCPSFVEFKMLLEEKSARDGGKFLKRLMDLEQEILIGSTYDGVADGIDEVNPIKIKGNQILNGMLIKKAGMKAIIDEANSGSGEALLSSASTDQLLKARTILETTATTEDEDE